MGDVATTDRMSAAEYLVWEREQRDKHEYHLGDVFLMAGGSPRHNYLASAISGELRLVLRGSKRGVLSSDQRVSAARDERYVYPDAVVVCGTFESEPGADDVLANPSMIVEVLSQSTERYDRGDKWEAYQQLPSLTDYLLVSQRAKRVEHYQRGASGSWQYRQLGAGDEIVLSSGARLSIDAVYRGAFDYPADDQSTPRPD